MKISNAASYDAICDKWDACRSENRINPCIQDFIKHIKPRGRVLDVGCGTGRPIAGYLAQKGFSVTGIDISPEMLHKAEALHLKNAGFQIADILEYESEEKFDAIIAFDSIWHIAYEKQPLIYKKFSELLHHNGCLLFTHGKKDGEIIGEMFGQKFYYSAMDIHALKQQLNDNHFELLSMTEDLCEEITGTRDLLVIAKYR